MSLFKKLFASKTSSPREADVKPGEDDSTLNILPDEVMKNDVFSSTLTEDLPGVLDSLNESIREFNDVAQDQKDSIVQQSASLHEVAVTGEEFVNTSRSIADNAERVEKSALASLESCRRGNTSLEKAIQEMQSLGSEVDRLVNDVHELEAQNRHISEIAEIIIEITDQLNLLALNAQIEAVGAGEHGRRFAVVAQEVKRLAESSKEATSRIQKNIKLILSGIGGLVTSIQRGFEATNKSIARVNEVADDIRNINEEVGRTHKLAQEIKIQTNQQTSAQQQLAQTLGEVDSAATSNASQISDQVSNAIMRLSDLAQFLTLILESTVLKDTRQENAGEGDLDIHE